MIKRGYGDDFIENFQLGPHLIHARLLALVSTIIDATLRQRGVVACVYRRRQTISARIAPSRASPRLDEPLLLHIMLAARPGRPKLDLISGPVTDNPEIPGPLPSPPPCHLPCYKLVKRLYSRIFFLLSAPHDESPRYVTMVRKVVVEYSLDIGLRTPLWKPEVAVQ